jgi:hypothetical protein
MHATRIVRSTSSSFFGGLLKNEPKLLLPKMTFWPTLYVAYQGAWTLMTEDSARKEFNNAIKNQIIKDKVLQNATNGSAITFSLFHNLQDPLFQVHKFDAQEFVAAVGPALENFHENIGLLRNQLPDHILREKCALEVKEKATSTEAETEASSTEEGEENDVESESSNLTEALLGTNYWRQQAEEDPEGPAGQLARMTTELGLDAFYYRSKLDTIGQSSTGKEVEYVPGSCSIHQVALLNARALEIWPEYPTTGEFTEFAASDMPEDPPIAAQMDVLYEVTQTYKRAIGSSDILEAVGDEDGTDTATVVEKKDDDIEEQKMETVSFTILIVAVLEGWLHKGPEKALRWKVALLRDASEFPNHRPSVERH